MYMYRTKLFFKNPNSDKPKVWDRVTSGMEEEKGEKWEEQM